MCAFKCKHTVSDHCSYIVIIIDPIALYDNVYLKIANPIDEGNFTIAACVIPNPIYIYIWQVYKVHVHVTASLQYIKS